MAWDASAVSSSFSPAWVTVNRGFPLGDLSAPSVGSIRDVCRSIPTVRVSVCLLASAWLSDWVCHLCVWMLLILTCLLWVFNSHSVEETKSHGCNMTAWVWSVSCVSYVLTACWVSINYMSQHTPTPHTIKTGNAEVILWLGKWIIWLCQTTKPGKIIYRSAAQLKAVPCCNVVAEPSSRNDEITVTCNLIIFYWCIHL